MENKILVLGLLILSVVLVLGCTGTQQTTTKEQSCTSSDGTVTTAMCCQSASDFPNNCLIGACGCSPDNSHSVKVCDCGEGRCFNGTRCQAVSAGAA
jgi:hypothetical protein